MTKKVSNSVSDPRSPAPPGSTGPSSVGGDDRAAPDLAGPSRSGDGPEPPELPHTAYAAAWEQTDSLLALRELIAVGSQVTPAVARRAALSHHELQTLEVVIEGAVGPVEIARELGVTSAAASGIVDRLAERGHVVRQPHVSDRRRTQVVITESGREEVLGYLMPMFTSLAALERTLTEEERVVITRYLRGATAAIRALL